MKNFNFLSMATAVVLLVTAVSCTPLQYAGGDDEYYTDAPRTSPNRIYVDDPYQGTIVLERDPYSGRYYQVNPARNSGYYGNNVYRNGGYNRGGGIYNTPRYRNNNGNYNRPRVTNPQPQPSEDQKRANEKQREEARRKILGGN